MDPSPLNEEPQNKFSQQDLLNQAKSWWKPAACVLAVVLAFAFLTGPTKAQKKEVEQVMEQVRELVIDGFRIEMSDNDDPAYDLTYIYCCFIRSKYIYAISVDQCPKDFQKKYSEFIDALKVAENNWEHYVAFKENKRNQKSVEKKEEMLQSSRRTGKIAYKKWIDLVYFSSKKYDLEPYRFDPELIKY
ncbi:MAG: hypothetical protein ACI4SG_04245 [Oligosphaeraceae bacterium]